MFGKQNVKTKKNHPIQKLRNTEQLQRRIGARQPRAGKVSFGSEKAHDRPRPEERKQRGYGSENQYQKKCFAEQPFDRFSFGMPFAQYRQRGIEQESRNQKSHFRDPRSETIGGVLDCKIVAEERDHSHVELPVQRDAEKGYAVRRGFFQKLFDEDPVKNRPYPHQTHGKENGQNKQEQRACGADPEKP